MHRSVYYHKTTYGFEEACRQLLRRAKDAGKYNIPSDGEKIKEIAESSTLYSFTDAYVDNIVREAVNDKNDVIQALAKSIQSRKPPKLLKEVLVLDERNKHDHSGAFFKQKCSCELKKLADSYGIPIGQFLLCTLKPITLEKRGDRFTVDEAKGMQTEKEDELIKVFVDDEKEPKSLVDIPYSIISKCSNFSLQIFRLYVVYDNSDRDKVIEELNAKVKDWDKAS